SNRTSARNCGHFGVQNAAQIGIALARALQIRRQIAGLNRRSRGCAMSTFDNPFDPSLSLKSSGCSCGRHISQAEHVRDAVQLRCLPVEADEKRYENVVASAVMRALFPKDVSRRALLHSLGASTVLAALSQFFPLKIATDVFASGGPIEKKDLKVGFIPI